VEPGKVGGGIGVGFLTCGLDPGADHGLGRTLAIGACDMDDGGQIAFGIAQGTQKVVHPVKREVDDPGVQRHHPFKNDFRGLCHSPQWRAAGPTAYV